MSRRVLLAAPPYAGHLFPLLVLGQGLRERGYQVEVATGAGRTDLLAGLGFAAHPLLSEDPGAFDAISDTPPVRSNPLRLTSQLRANLALLPRARRELDAILARGGFDVVLADFTAPVAGLAAQAVGVPWITTTPSPCALETRTGTPSYLGGWAPPKGGPGRVRDAVGRRAVRGFKRGMQALLARELRAAGTGVYRPDGSEAAYSPTRILGLGATEFELPRDWPDAFSMIGPVTATPGSGRGWRRDELPPGPLVLVTVGTHLPWAKRDLVAQAIAASHRLGHTFVVTMGNLSGVEPTDTLRGLVQAAERVWVADHLPYDDVMPWFDAVVHHGGAGVTYSAVRAAVPALVQPRDYDQFDHATRIRMAGAGLVTRRDLDHPGSVRALREVLAMDRTRLRELSVAIARYDPVAATAEAIEQICAAQA